MCIRASSLLWPLPLQSTGSRRAGSAAVAHGPSRSAACGILPDRGTNPRPLHWQADSQPLRHQGSPLVFFFLFVFFLLLILFFLRYAGLSPLWPLPLRSTGSGRAGSAAVAHGPSRSAACGIFPDRGTNPCPLHRQADSQPLHHQGSPRNRFLELLPVHFIFPPGTSIKVLHDPSVDATVVTSVMILD